MHSDTTNRPAVRVATTIRGNFASRLKLVRIRQGYLTARSLAEALEIDENRYTRWKRAEVEPDLAMLSKICKSLGVSPNELLGFDEPDVDDPIANGETVLEIPKLRTDFIFWRLASKLASLHQLDRKNSQETNYLKQASLAFLALRSDPFGHIASIMTDDRTSQLGYSARAELEDLISELIKSLADAGKSGFTEANVQARKNSFTAS